MLHPIAQASGQIRITRQGPLVSALYHRANAGLGWTLLRAHNRPDLPATVRVGPPVSAFWQNPPNLRIRFDEVVFSR